MQVVIPPIYERDDFEFSETHKDFFNRNEFSRNLTSLFSKTSRGLVVTINSKWGDGKTTFVKMWERELRSSPAFVPVYYDAFRNDFSNDAFLSIASLIHETLKQKLEDEGVDVRNQEQLKHLQKATKSLAVELVKMSAGIAITSLSGGIVSNNSVVNFLKRAFSRLTFDTLELDVDKKFQAHIESQNTIIEYQTQLAKILKSSDINQDRKLVFFVDELDRCRPDFAIQVIEKIKHLFNMDNVFFVLTINREQLLSTIASAYGVDSSDASIYLQKFIHIETQLPPLTGIDKKEGKNISRYLNSLLSEYELTPSIQHFKNYQAKLSELMSPSYLSVNPRGIERVFSLVSISVASQFWNATEHQEKLLFVMATIKIGDPELYEEYKAGIFNSHSKGSSNMESGAGENRLWKWLESAFEDNLNKTASNVFEIPEAVDVCRVLDIYRFPQSSSKESTYEKKESEH